MHDASFLPETNHTLPHFMYNYVWVTSQHAEEEEEEEEGAGQGPLGPKRTERDLLPAQTTRSRQRTRAPCTSLQPHCLHNRAAEGGNGLTRAALQPTKEC